MALAAPARFVGPLERLIYLKALPGLGQLPATTLAAVAEHVYEREFRAGNVVIAADRPVGSIFFVVEGEIESRYKERVLTVVRPPDGVGFIGMMASVAGGYEAVALTDCLTLELRADIMWDLMEDNFGLALTGIRQFAKQLRQAVSNLPPQQRADVSEPDRPYPEQPLDLVERLLLMERNPVFGQCNLDALAEFSRRSVEVREEPGRLLWKVGDRATYGLIIVWGICVCEDTDGNQWRVGNHYGVGFLDANSHSPRSYSVTTETRILGLRSEMEHFYDVLEENFGMARASLGFYATQLLELSRPD